MAIAFDNVGTINDTNVNGTIQWTHTVNANTNGILVAFFGYNSNGSINGNPTFNGTAMTHIIVSQSSGILLSSDLWYYKNPPTGAGTIKGTFSSSNSSKTGISLSYTGVDQTTPIAGSASALGTGVTSGSVTRTLAANNWWAGGAFHSNKPGTTNIGNERGTVLVNSVESQAGDATSGTLRWTGVSENWTMVAAELTAAATTNAALSTLTDPFSGASLATGTWTDTSFSGGTVAVSGGFLSCAPVANTGNTSANITSVGTYDLTSSYALVNVTQVVSQGGATYLYVQQDSNNKVYLRHLQGTLTASKVVASTDTPLGSVNYNSTTHAWWRIRESGGNTFFDTAPDGINWTNLLSVANPITVTAVKAVLEGYDFSADTAPGAAHFVNFNIAPPAISSFRTLLGVGQA